jgi:hypothetical protein
MQSASDYLGANDQESDIPDDIDHYCSDEHCENEANEYNENNKNGMSFPHKDELYEALQQMKNAIYLDMFQTGPSEKVHDPIILNKYLELIDRVWKSVGYDRPIVLDDQSAEVREAITRFIQILHTHLSEPNTENDKELRSQLLHLHLHCYPYCMSEQCLSSD